MCFGELVLTRSRYRRLGIEREPSGYAVCEPAFYHGAQLPDVGQALVHLGVYPCICSPPRPGLELESVCCGVSDDECLC